MINRDYDLRNPADVRELLRADQRLLMILSLAYKYNDLIVKIGYAAKRIKQMEAAHPESEIERLFLLDRKRELAGMRERKQACRLKLRQLCKDSGIAGDRAMPGRYTGLRPRKKSTFTGTIRNFTKETLYVFSDLYNEEAATAIRVNDIMFRSE